MDEIHQPDNVPPQDDLAKLDEIIAEYEAPLLRYAARILNNSSASQDVVQTTFIKLCHHWRNDAHATPQLSAWLYRVTHNAAVDYLRKESRRRALLRQHSEERQCLSQPNRDGPGLSEMAQRAARSLQSLSLRERQIVILKVYEEKSYREISEIAGLSEGNVGYILHHAMKKLAATLKRLTDQERI
jgi:RNA polymerase sigma-70 factor (ECF subfamily)